MMPQFTTSSVANSNTNSFNSDNVSHCSTNYALSQKRKYLPQSSEKLVVKVIAPLPL